jgi:hypothetical protein
MDATPSNQPQQATLTADSTANPSSGAHADSSSSLIPNVTASASASTSVHAHATTHPQSLIPGEAVAGPAKPLKPRAIPAHVPMVPNLAALPIPTQYAGEDERIAEETPKCESDVGTATQQPPSMMMQAEPVPPQLLQQQAMPIVVEKHEAIQPREGMAVSEGAQSESVAVASSRPAEATVMEEEKALAVEPNQQRPGERRKSRVRFSDVHTRGMDRSFLHLDYVWIVVFCFFFFLNFSFF